MQKRALKHGWHARLKRRNGPPRGSRSTAADRDGPGAALARDGTVRARGARAVAHRVPVNQALGCALGLWQRLAGAVKLALRVAQMAVNFGSSALPKAGEGRGTDIHLLLAPKTNFLRFDRPARKEARNPLNPGCRSRLRCKLFDWLREA